MKKSQLPLSRVEPATFRKMLVVHFAAPSVSASRYSADGNWVALVHSMKAYECLREYGPDQTWRKGEDRVYKRQLILWLTNYAIRNFLGCGFSRSTNDRANLPEIEGQFRNAVWNRSSFKTSRLPLTAILTYVWPLRPFSYDSLKGLHVQPIYEGQSHNKFYHAHIVDYLFSNSFFILKPNNNSSDLIILPSHSVLIFSPPQLRHL